MPNAKSSLFEHVLIGWGMCGACPCAGAEFALFAIPLSLVSFVPNFFFGSLLMLFGIEITLDWLVFSFRKVFVFAALHTSLRLCSWHPLISQPVCHRAHLMMK